MRAIAAQSSVSKALKAISSSISSGRDVAYDGGILINAKDGRLTFESTDAVRSIRYVMDAMVESEGSTVVPGELCVKIVRNMSDEAMTVSGDGRQTMLECGSTVARLHSLNPLAFPAFPTVNPDEMVEIPMKTLSEMVKMTKRSLYKLNDRPLFRGLYIHSDGDALVMESTNGNMASCCRKRLSGSSFDAVIDGYILSDAVDAMSDSVSIGVTKNQAAITSGSITYVCRRLEGRFPNWGVLLPKEFTTSVTFTRSDMKTALKRIEAIASDNGAVRLDIGDVLRLTVRSPLSGEMSEDVDAEIDGDSVTVGVYYGYITDVVTSATDSITMFADSTSGVVMFKVDDTTHVVGKIRV